MFLPPNTTSKLQPLDLGIIQNFKVHYRHFLLRFVLAKIEECTTVTDVAKSADLLMAMRWVARAWEAVSPDTISKCFKKAGILDSGMDVVDRGMSEEVDPFEDLDTDSLLHNLISRAMPADDRCTVEEYTNGEDTVPVCSNFDNDHGTKSSWKIGDSLQSSDKEEDEDNESQKIPPPKIQSFKEAILALEDVRIFLDSRSCLDDAAKTATLIDNHSYLFPN